MSETESKVVEIEALPVHYLEAGRGLPLVFLHGAGGAPPQGASFVSMLAEHHRVLLPSRPGFDQTPLGDCRAIASETRVIAGFVRAVAGGEAAIVAQSAGCAIACWLAILHPGLVSRLVLSAPSAFASHGARPPAPQELAQILYGEHPSWTAPPTLAEQQRIGRNAATNLGRWTAADAHALQERLPEIKAPTLLIRAEGDRLIPASAALPFEERIPSCRRVAIQGAAHELPIADGPGWVRSVREFIDRDSR